MSENDNLPPTPNKQTSSVPLKKETVRVTLKAADAPPAVPSATVPLAPPVRPPIPGGAPSTPTAPPMAPPRPTAPAPTIPLRMAGAAPTASSPAPTIRLATSKAPMTPGAAPTAPLKSPGLPTAGGTPTLPKATVQLQAPTQPLGTSFPSAPSQAATFQIEEDEEEQGDSTLFKVLSGVGLAAALVVLSFQLMVAKTWISVEDNPKSGDWMQLFE
jgi:hypothetical protein